jgi:hypothetical protein
VLALLDYPMEIELSQKELPLLTCPPMSMMSVALRTDLFDAPGLVLS